MKRKPGTVYNFNDAEQIIYDVWRRPLIISGEHIFVKQKDTFLDKLYGRSWYLLDNFLLIFTERGGYIEERSLQEVKNE